MTHLLRRLRERLWRLWGMTAMRLVFRPWLLAGTVSEADEVPERIPARRAFLVGAPSGWKWLVLDCPCRAGHRVMLNLDPVRRPCWNVRVSPKRRITVSPSIDYKGSDRSCHYLIKAGRVVWDRSGPSRTQLQGESRL